MKFLTFLIFLIIFFNYVIAENELNNSTKKQDKQDIKENKDKQDKDEERYREKFVQWSHKFSKTYKSDEFANKYSIFKKNMDYVENWNKGNSSMVLGLNKFADMSNDEFKTIFIGPSKKYTLNNNNNTQKNNPSPRSLLSSIYPSFDHRDNDVVSPVQDQDQCDCSYSFAAAGVIESAKSVYSGTPVVPLSKQKLIDCTPNYSGGCSGGDYIDALNYVISNQGISTESNYPFTGNSYGACRIGKTPVISSYTTITPGDESTMEDKLLEEGPIAVKIDASSYAFQLYQSGIYIPPQTTPCSTTNLNLNALVVGYDSMLVNGVLKKYWIMKTSWGDQFGIDGYVYMLKDEINNINHCGIASRATYVTLI